MRGLLFLYIILLALLLNSCSRSNDPVKDLRETYLPTDKRPFGGYIASSILQNSYPESFIHHTKYSAYTDMISMSDSGALYCVISKNFYADSLDADAILDYVYNGNTFFLASSNIDSSFLKRLYCKTINTAKLDFILEPGLSYDSVRLIPQVNVAGEKFSYYYLPFSSRFTEINDAYCRVLGYNGNGEPNCIMFYWGKGRMLLHTDARAFSNYFLLTGKNYLYMQQLMQLLQSNPENIYWNEYYAKKNRSGSGNDNSNKGFSSFSEIMKYPPLASAFWLVLTLLILYILFSGKRKQRIIRQLKPNVNSSVAFTETIARLYLQQKDNKNLSDKMIAYFNEHIRSHYFLTSTPGSEDFLNSLSRKSGVSLEKTTALYKAINMVSDKTVVDDYELLTLNEQIQQFYKIRK